MGIQLPDDGFSLNSKHVASKKKTDIHSVVFAGLYFFLPFGFGVYTKGEEVKEVKEDERWAIANYYYYYYYYYLWRIIEVNDALPLSSLLNKLYDKSD